MRAPFLLAFACSLLGVLVSCRPGEELVSPDIPTTPVLTSASTWGVVNIPYLKVLEESRSTAAVSLLLRKGDMVEIQSKIGEGNGLDYWLEVKTEEGSGWVLDNSLNVFDTRAQARTASERIVAGSDGS